MGIVNTMTSVLGEGTHKATEHGMTAQRASLYGILAGLTVLHWVGKQVNIAKGSATLRCNSTLALRASLKCGPVGITSAIQDNYDIM